MTVCDRLHYCNNKGEINGGEGNLGKVGGKPQKLWVSKQKPTSSWVGAMVATKVVTIQEL